MNRFFKAHRFAICSVQPQGHGIITHNLVPRVVSEKEPWERGWYNHGELKQNAVRILLWVLLIYACAIEGHNPKSVNRSTHSLEKKLIISN